MVVAVPVDPLGFDCHASLALVAAYHHTHGVGHGGACAALVKFYAPFHGFTVGGAGGHDIKESDLDPAGVELGAIGYAVATVKFTGHPAGRADCGDALMSFSASMRLRG